MANSVLALVKKKRIIIPTIILLFAFVVLCFKPICWDVSQTMTVQIIENISEGSATEGEMIVQGEYSFYLFRPDSFEGRIAIAAFPETEGKDVELITAETFPDHLVYRSWNGPMLNSESFGLIKAGFGMKQMIILKSNAEGIINLDGEQTCVILAGDTSLNDAWELLKFLKQLPK